MITEAVNLKYSDIISHNKALEAQFDNLNYSVGILSNIIINQIQPIIEMNLRNLGIPAKANICNYNNIIQDAKEFSKNNSIIVFWEVINLIEGLQYKAETAAIKEIDNIIEQTKKQIIYTLNTLSNSSHIIFNRFSSTAFTYHNIKRNNLDYITTELNHFLDNLNYPNLFIIDTNKIFLKLGIQSSIDLRYFYSSKALYTLSFFKTYCNHILPIYKSSVGQMKKALIFDCDNTLWKGILGEDGAEGIQMSSNSKNGVVFEEVQHIAKALSSQGIIIGLCSKNNKQDVENVLNFHNDMVLTNNDIVIKKVNWQDKVTNLKSIASELNIGLDSIVFVDDSDFEINLVKQQLPMVKVVQVPQQLSKFPDTIKEVSKLFFNISITNDDKKRIKEYQTNIQRTEEQSKFSNILDYLTSLDIEIEIFKNNKEHIPRIAQMTQKTNQFNLTTKRYTEVEITSLMEKHYIYTVQVKDKFGESGITGLAIVCQENKQICIDTFLLSCRIIGRDIEIAFANFILNEFKTLGYKECTANYIKTLKNVQVKHFYEKLGFKNESSNQDIKNYLLKLQHYKNKNIHYIGIKNERKN